MGASLPVASIMVRAASSGSRGTLDLGTAGPWRGQTKVWHWNTSTKLVLGYGRRPLNPTLCSFISITVYTFGRHWKISQESKWPPGKALPDTDFWETQGKSQSVLSHTVVISPATGLSGSLAPVLNMNRQLKLLDIWGKPLTWKSGAPNRQKPETPKKQTVQRAEENFKMNIVISEESKRLL